MSGYFAFDHIVWAQRKNLVQNGFLSNYAQKISLWCWFFGSLCGITDEIDKFIKVNQEYREKSSPSRLIKKIKIQRKEEIEERSMTMDKSELEDLKKSRVKHGLLITQLIFQVNLNC